MKIFYSNETKNRIYVKGYRFLSFDKNMSNKYSQNLLDTVKKTATDAIKTASKKLFKKQQKQLMI